MPSFQSFINKTRWLVFYLSNYNSFQSLPHTTIIGRNVRVISHGRNRSIALGQRVILSDGVVLETSHTGRISVGDNVWFTNGVIVSAQQDIAIGDFSMFGEYCSVRDFDHGTENNGVPMIRQPVMAKPVKIGNDVWVGRGAAVLKGVTIGDGAIVGANAVVTRSIAQLSVAVGIPARVIKERS